MKKTLLSLLISVFTLVATVNAQNSIKVSWDASSDINVTSYSLYYKTAAATNFSSATIVGRLNTTATLSATPYTLYEFYITAKDVNNLESDNSNKIRVENVYVNGQGKATVLTLLDVGTTNFSQFLLSVFPLNGLLTGTPPTVSYTSTNSIAKDLFAYRSPEIFSAQNITNYYGVYRALTNKPPTISVILE